MGKEIDIFERFQTKFKFKGFNTITGEEDLVTCPFDDIYMYNHPGIPKYQG